MTLTSPPPMPLRATVREPRGLLTSCSVKLPHRDRWSVGYSTVPAQGRKEEKERSCGKSRRGQCQSWGELLPWTAGAGSRRRTLIPSTFREMEGLQGQKPCALSLFFILYSLCCVAPRFRPMYLAPTCRSLRRHFCPRARLVMLYWLGRLKEQSLSARCTEPVRCPVVCKLSVATRSPSPETSSTHHVSNSSTLSRSVTISWTAV
jgi:hypothetical protein